MVETNQTNPRLVKDSFDPDGDGDGGEMMVLAEPMDATRSDELIERLRLIAEWYDPNASAPKEKQPPVRTTVAEAADLIEALTRSDEALLREALEETNVDLCNLQCRAPTSPDQGQHTPGCNRARKLLNPPGAE